MGKQIPTPVAIDPMALILSGRAYLVYVEKHWPHVPKNLREILQDMTTKERNAVLNRARALIMQGKAIEKEIKAIK
jgi:hypothetical protein